MEVQTKERILKYFIHGPAGQHAEDAGGRVQVGEESGQSGNTCRDVLGAALSMR